MSQSIDQLVDALPQQGLTVRALHMLDFAVPGQWQNVTGFDNMIRHVTGDSDPAFLASVRRRAIELFADESQGYQRAAWIYRLVDNADSKLGMAAMANKIGESVGFLSFLSKITPKADTAQSIDLAMKVIAELVAFCNANGFPGDGISDFVRSVVSYQKENAIRMAGIVTFDGLIPLGTDYGKKLVTSIENMGPSDLENNAIFQRIRGYLPDGGSTGAALNFIGNGVGALRDYVGNFASGHGITQDAVLGRMKSFIDFSEDKLDYLAGFIDMSTNYFEHTGLQSVSRSLIERAAGEV